jgi:hypothetical protein
MPSLVWDDGTTLACSALPAGGAAVIGRSPESAVVIAHGTVSRQHALVRDTGGVYTVENLSQTNTTKLNGYDIPGPAPLHDGDVIGVGSISARFHDLSTVGANSNALTCSHCGRENGSGERDCWFCGTSLVNAPTVFVNRRRAACRIATSTEVGATLLHGEGLRFLADGRLQSVKGFPDRSGCAAFIETPDKQPPIIAPGDSGAAFVNGAQVTAGQALSQGVTIVVGNERYVVLMV